MENGGKGISKVMKAKLKLDKGPKNKYFSHSHRAAVIKFLWDPLSRAS